MTMQLKRPEKSGALDALEIALEGVKNELDAKDSLIRTLLSLLPRCACGAPATHAGGCDAHGTGKDLPSANAIRSAIALGASTAAPEADCLVCPECGQLLGRHVGDWMLECGAGSQHRLFNEAGVTKMVVGVDPSPAAPSFVDTTDSAAQAALR